MKVDVSATTIKFTVLPLPGKPADPLVPGFPGKPGGP